MNIGTEMFAPWNSEAFTRLYEKVVQANTLVDKQRCYTLATLAHQCSELDGEVWECGVYKGGTAALLQHCVPLRRTLRLFDTFTGMPETDATKDWHRKGEFSDTSYEAVAKLVPVASIHKGIIPETFKGLEDSRISFAHIDVDIYSSVIACCEFIYPRLLVGGIMVFDDYGWPTCPGAKEAVDEYFDYSLIRPFAMPNGQAIVFKGYNQTVCNAEWTGYRIQRI